MTEKIRKKRSPPTMANSTRPWPLDRRLRIGLTRIEMVGSSRAAVPGDTDLSTPNASIDAISVHARWQCVKSWLQLVTERRYGSGGDGSGPGRTANQATDQTHFVGNLGKFPEVLA